MQLSKSEWKLESIHSSIYPLMPQAVKVYTVHTLDISSKKDTDQSCRPSNIRPTYWLTERAKSEIKKGKRQPLTSKIDLQLGADFWLHSTKFNSSCFLSDWFSLSAALLLLCAARHKRLEQTRGFLNHSLVRALVRSLVRALIHSLIRALKNVPVLVLRFVGWEIEGERESHISKSLPRKQGHIVWMLLLWLTDRPTDKQTEPRNAKCESEKVSGTTT